MKISKKHYFFYDDGKYDFDDGENETKITSANKEYKEPKLETA